MSSGLNVAKVKQFSDINISFVANPVTGDIGKIKETESVKTAIRNCILIGKGDRPFNPYFGSDIYKLLFEQYTSSTRSLVEDMIKVAIENYDDRVNIISVDVDEIRNGFVIRLNFSVLNVDIVDELTTTITRLR